MAVRIRLKRMGSNNNPFYRIVVAKGQNPTVGKAIEYIGTYDPKSAAGTAILKHDRYQYWVGVGAIPSDTVRSLVKRALPHASNLPKTEEAASDAVVEAPVAAE